VGEGVDFPHRSILATTPHPPLVVDDGRALDVPAVIDEALALGDKLGEAGEFTAAKRHHHRGG
jgi:hypothetical protein